MDRLERLERDWFFYKLKQYIRSSMMLIAAVVLGAVTAYILLNTSAGEDARTIVNTTPPSAPKGIPPSITAEPREIVTPPKPKAEVVAVAPVQPQPEVVVKPKKSPMQLGPSLQFENSLTQRLSPPQQLETPPQAQPSPQDTGQLTPVDPPRTATIRRVSSLAELEDAFNKQPTYAKAVDIAEAYLKRKDPQNAYNWALKANSLDQTDERSWAVFASASVQLGYKERAINALNAYLANRNSEKLFRLLKELEATTPKE
ncbi:MAG: hypothetical protein LBT81_04120 [Helicobacteraceae bacterium]|jgi:hypothetical protein|nr:hypothetical protein [Helicobacteraceae bacterium]